MILALWRIVAWYLHVAVFMGEGVLCGFFLILRIHLMSYRFFERIAIPISRDRLNFAQTIGRSPIAL